jgi:Tfp pilus assembly protein PilV
MKTTNKFFLSRKSQAGISNIQIMVGVLISAILILGGIGLIRYIDKAKVNNDLSELTELKARTVAYGASHGGNFAGFTNELAVGLDFFPTNRVSGAAGARTVANQWKGAITVAVASTNIQADSLLFTYTGVPSTACKELVIQAASIASFITVNSATVKDTAAMVNEGAAITACDGSNDNASIAYAMTK